MDFRSVASDLKSLGIENNINRKKLASFGVRVGKGCASKDGEEEINRKNYLFCFGRDYLKLGLLHYGQLVSSGRQKNCPTDCHQDNNSLVVRISGWNTFQGLIIYKPFLTRKLVNLE